MRVPHSWLGVLGTLALAGLPAPVGAQAVGSEFQINTYTTHNQQPGGPPDPGGQTVAADASGNFVVVWQSYGQDGSLDGVFAQRYDSAGAALGGEFRVNSYTTFRQEYPAVAASFDGDFVVVWKSFSQDGDRPGIFGQRYDSQGVPQGGEFQVNTYTTHYQEDPSVAMDAAGNFIVVWDSIQNGSVGTYGQRYDSQGVPQGGEFKVSSYTTLYSLTPSVASDASGNFVVVWESYNPVGRRFDVHGRRFDSGGGPLGGEFRVNSYRPLVQFKPAVSSDASGNFVVVWQSHGQDGNMVGIFGQRYDSQGVPRGGEFQVNTYTTGVQQRPSVASDASGNFVVAWESISQDSSGYGILGQRYDSGGVTQGEEFLVNSYTTNNQRKASVVVAGPDQFVVVWESYGQDGSVRGVFGQRFSSSSSPSTLHVGDLDRRAKNVGVNWRAQVTTRVHDAGHAPVSGALVTLDVSVVGLRTCLTTAAGDCEVIVTVSDISPSLTFTVTNLSKAGFSYDPGANHDPDPDSDGTVIVVNQP